MNNRRAFWSPRFAVLWVGAAACAFLADVRSVLGQPVATNGAPVIATIKLDQTRLKPGEKTVLRAFARIAAGVIADPDQIFSWNIDLLTFDPAIARIDPAGLLRTSSDRDPETSSGGTTDGPNLRGIRDTFLNLAAAGRAEAVELFSVPVIAEQPGIARFRLRPGSRGLALEADFLVVPLGDGPFLEGGDYGLANVELNVIGEGPIEPPTLAISLTPGGKVRIETIVPAGTQWMFEISASVDPGAAWSPLLGGVVTGDKFAVEVDVLGSRQFFRARQL